MRFQQQRSAACVTYKETLKRFFGKSGEVEVCDRIQWHVINDILSSLFHQKGVYTPPKWTKR